MRRSSAPSQCPNGTDSLAYASGFAAGRATRERASLAGSDCSMMGPWSNQFEPGSPRQEPTIIDERATPAKFVGIVEAADADAAIEEAIKEFEIKDPSRRKRLIGVRRKS
jgi:hypothetical protein